MRTPNVEVVYLVSRRYQRHAPSGRTAIFRQVLRFLRAHYTARLVAPVTVLESATWRVRFHAALALFSSLLFPTRPLQAAVYSNPTMRRSLRRKLKGPATIIMVDGLRLLPLALPYAATCRIVLDMDDLLSRRYRHHLRLLGAASPGALGRRLTEYFGPFASTIMKLGTKLEIKRLHRLEHRAATEAHDIIFTSSYEARMFRRLYPRTRATTHSHPLPIGHPVAHSATRSAIDDRAHRAERPVVFGFLGSDSVPQNALSIDFLLGLWATEPRPSARLLIAGKQHRTYCDRPDIRFTGFLPSLDGFFQEIDALLAPAILPGGVKIKVLDALASGCPVVGTRCTFEGIPMPKGYPLVFKKSELSKWVRLPNSRLHEQLWDARCNLYTSPLSTSLRYPADQYAHIFKHEVR